MPDCQTLWVAVVAALGVIGCEAVVVEFFTWVVVVHVLPVTDDVVGGVFDGPDTA